MGIHLIPQVIQDILKRIENLKEELVSLTSNLIKFQTISPPSNTLECAEYIVSYLEKIGLEAKIYSREKGKANVHVRVPGGSEKTIIWLGHLDVVPEGRHEEWAYEPFSGFVVGDKIYGRGASDMKGSCAAALIAAGVLSEVKCENKATVDFWFTCDEEVGSRDGTRWLLEAGLIRGDACLIGDSLARDPIYEPYIDVGCRGYLRILLKAFGKTAHASMPFYGDNAIEKLLAAIEVVKKISEYRLNIPVEIETIIKSSTEYLLSREDLNEKQRDAIRKIYYYPTVSLTMINGGVKINVIPDYAEASFDIRVTPGANLEEISGHIEELIAQSGISGVSVNVMGLESGYYESWDSNFAASLKKAIKLVTGVEPKPKILLGATDGVPVKRALRVPCLGFGAGVEELAHAPNEYVTIDGLLTATKVYSILPLIFAGLRD
ncbi:MAG: M20 family metallopeptidase [Candidatus Bathyarchaeia archaeon]